MDLMVCKYNKGPPPPCMGLTENLLNLSIQSSKSDLPFPLLGPPEIYTPAPVPVPVPVPAVSDPFMDLMVSKYNKGTPPPCMGLTENLTPTFLSSGNPCLDFFFHVVPDTPSESVTSRLQLAWDQDPLTALKLVCNLRGVRGTGKADKEGFYAAALWLHGSHPMTLAHNTSSIAEFGYFKDLPEILYRLLEGLDAHKKKNGRVMKNFFYKFKEELSNEEKRIAVGKRIVDKYNNDPVYRFLHDQISNTFTERLKSDLLNLHKGNLRNISFAAKWCPSLYSFYDRYTLLCESIARRLFPRDHYPEYQGIEDAHYAYRVRDRLRKEVLVPLRKALKVLEVYMSAQEWGVLPYNRVPSIAMKNYKETFMKRDKERFEEYLGSVKRGDRKIAAGALLPHQIIESVRKGGDGAKVAELQWQRIVEDLSEKGTLKNCLAICDVSGSMTYRLTIGIPTPLDVSVALGLLVSDLSEEPWKGKLITFSRNPQLQMIKGESLESKVSSIERMHWDLNTDFQRVFDKILEVAKEGKLSEEQMIKRLFVFSDMEFDLASWNPWETDYEAICRKFKESGYGSCVPEIVFWNLRDSRATPVPSHQKAVALVSGFSKNLLKVFLKEDGILNPEHTMESAIARDEYNKLVVID
ncbi:uncharacterized protein LOC132278214 [Cornus florida]|uniref:uncharacterized protein LOC132278214 n=1 Tax=Cornus florida TaxID=4283 RepID=UPI00289EB51C|nr:uncharacterized protein LOC132278214 [Cornus florida]